jgi:hypothetical protein
MKPILIAALLTITTTATAEPRTLIDQCAEIGEVGEIIISARDAGARAGAFIDKLSQKEDEWVKKLGMMLVYDAYSTESANVTPDSFGDKWFLRCVRASGGLSI